MSISFRNRETTNKTQKATKLQATMREDAILRAKQLIEVLRDIACFNKGDIEAADDATSNIRRAISSIRDINGEE